MEHRNLALQLGKACVWIDGPRVAQPGGATDSLVGIRSQPDRRARPLHGQHGEALLVEAVAVPFGCDGLALQQTLDDIELVEEHAQLLLRHPKRVEFLLPIAKPNAEHEATARNGVERRGVLGQLDGVEQRQQGNVRSDAHVARLGCDAA